MAASIVTIASAVVDHLNSATSQASFRETFTASRVFSPQFEREKLSGLAVDVFTAGDDQEALARSGDLHTFRVGVVVRKPANPDSTTDGDDLLELLDQIKDSLKLTNQAGAGYAGMTNDPLYSLDHLEQRREFLSVVFLTYKKGR